MTRIVAQAQEPTATAQPAGARVRLAWEGQDIARLERNEPCALGVVADGEDDGHVGEGGIVVAVKSDVVDVPRRAVRQASKGFRGRIRVGVGEPERHAGRRDTDGADAGPGAALEGQAQAAIGGLEGMECRDAGEAVQEGRRVERPLGRLRSRDGRTREPVADPAPLPVRRLSRRRPASQAQGDQFGQVSCRFGI